MPFTQSVPVDLWDTSSNSVMAGVIEQQDTFEGVTLLPHKSDKDFLVPFQVPERSLFKELAFIITSSNMSEKSFELELELVIAKIKDFSFEDPDTSKSCEEHKSDPSKQTASCTDYANPPIWFPNFWQIKTDIDQQIAGLSSTTSLSVAPEIWEFTYNMHPNLQGAEFPFFIEVITHKNEKPLIQRWFSVNTTTNISKSGISAITKCCSDLMEDFNSTDKVYFYLDQTSIDSLIKNKITSQIFFKFIEIIEYLAEITGKKCCLINRKKCSFPSTGNVLNEEKLIVRPSPIELKDTIRGHVSAIWIKKFNSTDKYRQTKTFISEPSEIVSKDLLALPRNTARNVISFLTGHGTFMKHLYKMDPIFYKTDECRVCNEGGSVECPLHFIFECEALKWDRERIFGQFWLDPCNRPALAGPRQGKGSAARNNVSQATNTTIRPANNALAGLASQAGNSSFNVPHPLSSLYSWTIKQIQEFVSIDSFLEVYVPQHIGDAHLNSKSVSPVVQAAQV